MKRIGSWAARRLRLLSVVVVAAVGLGWSVLGAEAAGHHEPQTVVAQFADASPLLVGNDVKVDGVAVGTVTAMSVVDGHAAVTFTVDERALPLHVDATAAVRPVSLLGERFLDLGRGTPAAPVLRPGGVIPLAHTTQNTDLDQVLNVFDQNTGDALAALVTMLGQGMQGNGTHVADTIKALAPAMTDASGLAKVLNEQNTTLNQLVDNVEPVAQSLARDNGQTLDSLVESTHNLLATTAGKQQQVQQTLAQLPATLAQARSTLSQLAGTAGAATPVLADIRPVTGNLQAISDEITRFTESADPALTHAQPVLDKAQALLDAARPVTQELLKASPPLRADAAALKPVTAELANNIGDVMNFVRGWALSTNGSDGLSHYFRALFVVDPRIATGLLPSLAGQPQTAAPAPTGQAPAAGKPPAAAPAPLGGLLAPKTGPDGSVTGMSQGQENGALQFLLGGN
ncbi:MAG TPA: MlaD family protein [Amycolatopsis sp.]|uniref:MlaD family protein n=1 Tax=unclassified Amycolatopsis TaxID=2618356 RepID=UPI00106EEDFA|nr:MULTISPECIES: MlaD family protein [unclassified Amycolatopsis]HWD05778.1 MlaD family protein [Amycolatopsis sp.]